MEDLFLSIFIVLIVLGLVWVIPGICICIFVTISYLIQNKKPIYVRDIKEELNSVDYERVRWVPFLNIVMLLAFILGIFIRLAEIIYEIKPINKLINKIKKYTNILNNFFNNIRLK